MICFHLRFPHTPHFFSLERCFQRLPAEDPFPLLSAQWSPSACLADIEPLSPRCLKATQALGGCCAGESLVVEPGGPFVTRSQARPLQPHSSPFCCASGPCPIPPSFLESPDPGKVGVYGQGMGWPDLSLQNSL